MGKRKQQRRHAAVLDVLASWAGSRSTHSTDIPRSEWNALASRVLDRLAAVKMCKKPTKWIKKKPVATRRVLFGLLYEDGPAPASKEWKEERCLVPLTYSNPMTWWHEEHGGEDTRDIEHVVVVRDLMCLACGLADESCDCEDEGLDEGFDSRLHGAD